MTTEILARIVSFDNIGTEDPVATTIENTLSNNVYRLDIREAVRAFTIGDRSLLLLHLRKMMLGDKMLCELECLSCKEIMSLELKVSNFIELSDGCPKDEYSAMIDQYNLKIRPVNGEDQEAVLLLGKKISMAGYKEYIVRRCVTSSNPSLPKTLSVSFVAQTSSILQRIDPQGHLVLSMTCPSCKQDFTVPFYPEGFIFQEIFSRQERLEQEVHLIAFYYHWDINEILSLPTTRRKRYVELILQTIRGGESLL